MREKEITKKKFTPETERRIFDTAIEWKAKKVGLDAGAGTLGVSVLDHLMETKIRNRLVALNNRSIAMDKNDKPKMQMLLKEDMHLTLLAAMEHGEIELLDDNDLRDSLRSFQFEYVKENDGTSRMRISGRNNDPVEGLIRAVHLAKKEKALNLFVSFVRHG